MYINVLYFRLLNISIYTQNSRCFIEAVTKRIYNRKNNNNNRAVRL